MNFFLCFALSLAPLANLSSSALQVEEKPDDYNLYADEAFSIFLRESLANLSSSPFQGEEESGNYNLYADEALSTFLKQVHKEYGFECLDTRRFGRLFKIEQVSVHFSARNPATVDEARELEVILTEKLAQIINAHEKIRPFLEEHPFPYNRIDIAISFPHEPGKFAAANDKVSFVFQERNRIFYRTEHPITRDEPICLKDEPYEEAREIVRKKASTLPK